jgi:hypothetical protein
MHPLLPLLAWQSPVAWMRTLLTVHTVFGALGMWRLCRVLDVRPLVTSICVATFMLATPSQNYLVRDFWPSPWIALTSMPWVLLCAWRVIEGEERGLWTWTVVLGLLSGLIVVNGNPGTAVAYGVFVPALAVTRFKASMTRWRYLAAAGVIMLGSPRRTPRCSRPRAGTFHPSSRCRATIRFRLQSPGRTTSWSVVRGRCSSAGRSRCSVSWRAFEEDGGVRSWWWRWPSPRSRCSRRWCR